MRRKKLIGVFIGIMILSTVFTGCKREKKAEETNTPATPVPTAEPTLPPDNTFEGLKPVVPGITGAPEADPDAGQLEEGEAVKIIQDTIGEQGYYFELLDDHLNIGDNTYFIYQVSDGTSVIEPAILVNKVSGELLCYYADGSTAPFSEFPLYSAPDTGSETASKDRNEFTKEDAGAKLGKLSPKTLGLPEKLSEYTIEYDDWTTNIDGLECYGINVFADSDDARRYLGAFYVAVNGTKIYKLDSIQDDFVELKQD